MPKAVQKRIVMPAASHQAVSASWPADQPVAGYAACPAHVIDPDAYGLVVEGDCLAPHVRHGDTAILSPVTSKYWLEVLPAAKLVSLPDSSRGQLQARSMQL